MKKFFLIVNHPATTQDQAVYFRGTAKSAMSLVAELNKQGNKCSLKSCKKASEKREAKAFLKVA